MTDLTIFDGRDEVGQRAITYTAANGRVWAMGHYLTPCCAASVKGGERGAVCRACHQPVDDRLGMAWEVEAPDPAEADAEWFAALRD